MLQGHTLISVFPGELVPFPAVQKDAFRRFFQDKGVTPTYFWSSVFGRRIPLELPTAINLISLVSVTFLIVRSSLKDLTVLTVTTFLELSRLPPNPEPARRNERSQSASATPSRLTVRYGIVRGMAGEVLWRQLFCRGSGCGAMFYICNSCYRGQVYCGEGCRHRMRREQRRRATRKHQESREGRLDHRDRQRAYRERCRLRRVTDATSPGGARSGTIKKPLTETGIHTPWAEVFRDRPGFERRKGAARPVCIVCGRVDVKKIDQEREKR